MRHQKSMHRPVNGAKAISFLLMGSACYLHRRLHAGPLVCPAGGSRSGTRFLSFFAEKRPANVFDELTAEPSICFQQSFQASPKCIFFLRKFADVTPGAFIFVSKFRPRVVLKLKYGLLKVKYGLLKVKYPLFKLKLPRLRK